MDTVEFMNAIYEYEKTLGVSQNILQGDLLTSDAKNMLYNDENAFLFGLIADQSVHAEVAWSLPYRLSQRLGSFSMNEIVENFSIEEFQQIIAQKPSLHRYPSNIGKYLWLAAKQVLTEYNGSAKNIWQETSAKVIIKRLEDFKGISHKKASLACLLLIRDLGLNIPDKENIDIVYDLHIRRIFSRMGLCKKDSMNEVVTAARILNPGFPGYLTSSLWAIGRQICRPTNPQCDNCPINKFCEHLLTETPV